MKWKIPLISFLILLCNLAARPTQPAGPIQKKEPNVKGNGFARQGAGDKLSPPFRVDVNLVVVHTSVMDRHRRYVAGLERENFHVFENKIEQDLSYFAYDAGPISAGIVFDCSGSMKGSFAVAKKSMERFLAQGNEEDEAFLITFNDKVALAADFTRRESDLKNIIGVLRPGGGTAFYDAVYIGLDKLRETRHPRKVLIIISDGEDNRSRHSFGDVKKMAMEGDVQIYVISPQPSRSEDAQGYGNPIVFGQSILGDLVNLTGGRGFFPENLSDIDYYIDQIHTELRHQYVLGFHSRDRDSKESWRKIQVKLAPPDGMVKLTVRARAGYYAPRR